MSSQSIFFIGHGVLMAVTFVVFRKLLPLSRTLSLLESTSVKSHQPGRVCTDFTSHKPEAELARVRETGPSDFLSMADHQRVLSDAHLVEVEKERFPSSLELGQDSVLSRCTDETDGVHQPADSARPPQTLPAVVVVHRFVTTNDDSGELATMMVIDNDTAVLNDLRSQHEHQHCLVDAHSIAAMAECRVGCVQQLRTPSKGIFWSVMAILVHGEVVLFFFVIFCTGE